MFFCYLENIWFIVRENFYELIFSQTFSFPIKLSKLIVDFTTIYKNRDAGLQNDIDVYPNMKKRKEKMGLIFCV